MSRPAQKRNPPCRCASSFDLFEKFLCCSCLPTHAVTKQTLQGRSGSLAELCALNQRSIKMDYVSIFDEIPWKMVGLTVIQTFSIYVFVLCGLKIVGRRVFAEMGPQDLILLFLVAEACDVGLTPEEAGYWGTLASVITLLGIVGITERIEFLRKVIENKPVVLFHQGRLLVKLDKYLINEDELDRAVRKYGFASYRDAEMLILEDDGNISAVLNLDHHPHRQAI